MSKGAARANSRTRTASRAPRVGLILLLERRRVNDGDDGGKLYLLENVCKGRVRVEERALQLVGLSKARAFDQDRVERARVG